MRLLQLTTSNSIHLVTAGGLWVATEQVGVRSVNSLVIDGVFNGRK